MHARAFGILLFGMGMLIPAAVDADVFTWVDASGVTNVSNLPPPDGVKSLNVVRSAPKDPAREAQLREAAREAEVRALNERVQQLQADVVRSRQEPAYVAPPVQYVAQPAPVVIVVQPPAPAPVYAEPAAGCSWGWGNCGFGFWPGFYPSGVVVLNDRHSRHDHPHRPMHPHPHSRGSDRWSWTVAPPIQSPLTRSTIGRK